jgi:hypothetical protein
LATPGSGGPAFGSARPGSYGQPESDSGSEPSDSRAAAPTYGSARPVPPFGDGRDDDGESPFGARPEQPSSPFGVRREPGASFGAASPFGPGHDDQAGSDDVFGQPEQSDDNPGGYPQRVPGAALGSPAAADSRNGAVPAPRDPSENPPATGSARPVAASASVPTASRTAPVEASEIPPAAAPQARVYGRPAPVEDADDEAPAEPPRDADQGFGSFSADSPFGPRPGAELPFGPRPGADSPFGPRPGDDRPGGEFGSPAYPNAPGSEPGVPGVAPQSPARASARASASARVAPAGGPGNPPTGMSAAPALPGAAPEPAPPGSPYSDRPGAPGPRPGEPYSELTTDIAGREQQPYVPAPALPQMPPGLNGLDPATQPRNSPFGPGGTQSPSGFGPGTQSPDGFGSGPQSPDGFPQSPGGFGPDNNFPGSANRATVKPPTPEETTSWPGVEADQGRFDSFKAEPAPAKPETPHVRLLPIMIAVVVAAGLILGIVFGIVYLVAGGKDQSLSVIQGECVKREGESAVKSECSDATSFQVVSIVADKKECADPQQPHVVNKTSDGKDQVLCLKPNS